MLLRQSFGRCINQYLILRIKPEMMTQEPTKPCIIFHNKNFNTVIIIASSEFLLKDILFPNYGIDINYLNLTY